MESLPPYVTDLELSNGRTAGLSYRTSARQLIKTLDLAGKGSELTARKLATFPNVIAVKCSSNKKCDFAQILGCLAAALPHLQRIDLCWNDFTKVPREIVLLKELRRLELTRNKLATLGSEIFEVPWLLHLCLSGNGLKAIPEGLAELKQLRRLEAWDNRLEMLPEAIRALTSLQNLQVGSNKKLDVNDTLDKVHALPRLQSLGLSESGSTRPLVVTDRLCDCRSLRNLSLGYMGISALPKHIGKLSALTYLGLVGNQLSQLPDSIVELKELERLDVTQNPLPAKETCAQIKQLAKIKQLSVPTDDSAWEPALVAMGFRRAKNCEADYYR